MKTDNIKTEKIAYFDILKYIKEEKIEPNSYTYLDNKGITWSYSDDIRGFEHIENGYGFCDDKYKEFLTEKYDELDLLDLYLTLIPIENKIETPRYKAIQEIIDNLEQQYMDLSMEIDNCQGCMTDVDVAVEKLNIYEELVKSLGGNIKEHLQELTDNWFNKAKEMQDKVEKEIAKKDEVIKPLPFPALELMDVDEHIRTILWNQNDKINEICEILRADEQINYKKYLHILKFMVYYISTIK
jgi:gas vesicle protein